MNKIHRDFILKHADWTKWYQEDLLLELDWVGQHGLIIETHDDKELTELGLFVATGYPETIAANVMSENLGAYDPQGSFLFCMLYVRHKKITKRTIDWNKLKTQWFAKYPNIRELCYRAHAHDGKLVRVKIAQ